MATLKIPDQIVAGLIVIRDMPDETYQSLFGALSRAPGSFAKRRELSVWISSEVQGVSSTDIETTIDSLTSFHRVLERSGKEVSRIVSDILDALHEKSHDTRTTSLDERLKSLIPLSALNLLEAKAKELQMQDERLLLEARILTDARPVFGDDPTLPPLALTVIHALRIRYYDSGTGEPKEIFIALDSKDISDLKRAAQRAEDKEKSLRKALGTSSIPVIELD